MLLLETLETVGGVWLALSAVAFILGAAFVRTRKEVESVARRELLADGGQALPSVSRIRERELDRLDAAKKRPVSDKHSADLVKAA